MYRGEGRVRKHGGSVWTRGLEGLNLKTKLKITQSAKYTNFNLIRYEMFVRSRRYCFESLNWSVE